MHARPRHADAGVSTPRLTATDAQRFVFIAQVALSFLFAITFFFRRTIAARHTR
jgi:hypothetical protein